MYETFIAMLSFLLVLACGFIIGLLFTRKPEKTTPPQVSEADPCARFHDYKPIDARQLSSEALAYTHTVLLRRCSRCEQHITVVYPGAWTIGDFLKPESDIDALEGMLK